MKSKYDHVHARLIPQDDALYPLLTVRETLRFAAELRIPNMSKVRRACGVVRYVSAQRDLVGYGVRGGSGKQLRY